MLVAELRDMIPSFQHQHSNCTCTITQKSKQYGLLLLLGLVVVVFWSHVGSSKVSRIAESTLEPCSASIQRGIASNGIAYYRCCRQNTQHPLHDTPVSSIDAIQIQLVLLHGARFTKEDYKTSGLLDMFCTTTKMGTSIDGVVLALDLPVRASAQELQTMLTVLVQDRLVTDRPISLVTPSASGYGVVDWINTGNMDTFRTHIRHWIPVASPAITQASTERLEQIHGPVRTTTSTILAVYGDQDAMGKQVSQRLGTYAGATVVEIPGKHPCYLDSPDLFVTIVLKFVSSTSTSMEP